MEVKIIKNLDSGKFYPINPDYLLQICDSPKEIDGYKINHFFLFNPANNIKTEIAPEIEKCNIAKVYYSTVCCEYLIFSDLVQINNEYDELTYYKYNIADGKTESIHKQRFNKNNVDKNSFKCFMLTNNYCLLEYKSSAGNLIILKDLDNNITKNINNEFLLSVGIEKMTPLSGNNSCIQLGEKFIGIVNVNQFVSDLIIDLEDVVINYLEQENENYYIHNLFKLNDNVVYLRHDKTSDACEIVFYNFENNVKKVRFNSYEANFNTDSKVLIINSVPYKIVTDENFEKLINLNTKKSDYEFNPEITLEYAIDDLIVTKRSRNGVSLFGLGKQQQNYIEVYRVPDTAHPIFKIKGDYKGCVKHCEDLLIFV